MYLNVLPAKGANIQANIQARQKFESETRSTALRIRIWDDIRERYGNQALKLIEVELKLPEEKSQQIMMKVNGYSTGLDPPVASRARFTLWI